MDARSSAAAINVSVLLSAASCAALCAALAGALTACSDDALDRVDSGVSPSDAATDAATGDAGVREDASPSDAGREDAAAFPCTALEPTASPATPAALTGRLDITDYDFFDEQTGTSDRVRNAGFNFFTQTLPVSPLSDGALFTAIAKDTCVATDIFAPGTDLRPARNVGTGLSLTNTGTVSIRWSRETDMGEVRYRLATQADTVAFFDDRVVKLDDTWTWSTPGDPVANIRAASATVGPVEDFAVTPAFTSTGTPAELSMTGTTIRWTAPVHTPGEVSIVLARALNMTGDARFLICRANDDGELTLSAQDMSAFGPTPGLAFDLAVSRSQLGALCNEGVQAGAAVHTLVFLGAGIVR